ncbi:hypothetical protein BC629DRAFT_1612092 [Irpex lacteus]|nr:hypothetical protein BC629DRAFT_1612092 [Irpex lacteus]
MAPISAFPPTALTVTMPSLLWLQRIFFAIFALLSVSLVMVILIRVTRQANTFISTSVKRFQERKLVLPTHLHSLAPRPVILPLSYATLDVGTFAQEETSQPLKEAPLNETLNDAVSSSESSAISCSTVPCLLDDNSHLAVPSSLEDSDDDFVDAETSLDTPVLSPSLDSDTDSTDSAPQTPSFEESPLLVDDCSKGLLAASGGSRSGILTGLFGPLMKSASMDVLCIKDMNVCGSTDNLCTASLSNEDDYLIDAEETLDTPELSPSLDSEADSVVGSPLQTPALEGAVNCGPNAQLVDIDNRDRSTIGDSASLIAAASSDSLCLKDLDIYGSDDNLCSLSLGGLPSCGSFYDICVPPSSLENASIAGNEPSDDSCDGTQGSFVEAASTDSLRLEDLIISGSGENLCALSLGDLPSCGSLYDVCAPIPSIEKSSIPVLARTSARSSSSLCLEDLIDSSENLCALSLGDLPSCSSLYAVCIPPLPTELAYVHALAGSGSKDSRNIKAFRCDSVDAKLGSLTSAISTDSLCIDGLHLFGSGDNLCALSLGDLPSAGSLYDVYTNSELDFKTSTRAVGKDYRDEHSNGTSGSLTATTSANSLCLENLDLRGSNENLCALSLADLPSVGSLYDVCIPGELDDKTSTRAGGGTYRGADSNNMAGSLAGVISSDSLCLENLDMYGSGENLCALSFGDLPSCGSLYEVCSPVRNSNSELCFATLPELPTHDSLHDVYIADDPEEETLPTIPIIIITDCSDKHDTRYPYESQNHPSTPSTSAFYKDLGLPTSAHEIFRRHAPIPIPFAPKLPDDCYIHVEPPGSEAYLYASAPSLDEYETHSEEEPLPDLLRLGLRSTSDSSNVPSDDHSFDWNPTIGMEIEPNDEEESSMASTNGDDVCMDSEESLSTDLSCLGLRSSSISSDTTLDDFILGGEKLGRSQSDLLRLAFRPTRGFGDATSEGAQRLGGETKLRSTDILGYSRWRQEMATGIEIWREVCRREDEQQRLPSARKQYRR